MVALVTLLAIVVGLLGILVAGLLRGHAEVLRALHELGVNLDPTQVTAGGGPVRRTAPGVPRPGARQGPIASFDISGESPNGDAVSVSVIGADRLTLVAFLSSTCLSCRDFWTAFADPRLRVPGGARLVAVTKGNEAESPSALRKLAPPDVITVQSTDAWVAYGVPVAPYFVLVDGSSGDVVGEGAATTWEQVANLMDNAMADAGVGRQGGRGRLAREARVDDELRAAGVEPGDPSLYPRPDPRAEA
jgi:hypothetical protein